MLLGLTCCPCSRYHGLVPWQDPPPVMRKANELLELLPGLFDIERVQNLYPLSRSENRNRVLLQEVQLYNVLLSTISSSLQRLIACMQGRERLDVDTDEFSRQVYEGKVPGEWMRVSMPCDEPLMAYMKKLNDGVDFFNKWIRAGIPSAFWLPAFFFPQVSMLFGLLSRRIRGLVSIWV